MCEATATVTAGLQHGWGLALIDSTRQKEKALKGVEILLSSAGELRVLPSRFVVDETLKITPIGPIPVTNFKKGERNSVAVIIRDGKSLEIFINGVQACEPVLLKDALTRTHLHLASAGGTKDSLLAFESFKVWSLPSPPEEPGWVQLFNGKGLTGWVPRIPPKLKSEPVFDIYKSTLVAHGSTTAPSAGYLRTEQTYDHFILELECQSNVMDPYNKTIGGLLFQIAAPDLPLAAGDGSDRGVLMTIPPGNTDGVVRASADSGSKYLLNNIDWRGFKSGWNQLRVESAPGKFVVTLNGKQLAVLNGFQSKAGYIAISAQATGMRYRNIRIQELPAAGSGWVQLFNGKGLTGWVSVYDKKKYPTAPWDIVDPVLVLKGGKAQETGYLRTEKQYREFHLRFDYKHTSFAPQQKMNNSAILWGVQGPDDPSTKNSLTGVEGGGLELAINNELRPAGTVYWHKGVNEKVRWTNVVGSETPADKWNRAEIISKSGELELRINGASKVVKGYQPLLGHVGLFCNQQGLHLRNIEIRELPARGVRLGPALQR